MLDKELHRQEQKAAYLKRVQTNNDITDVDIIEKVMTEPIKTKKFKSLLAHYISKLNPRYINTDNTLAGLCYVAGYKISTFNSNIQLSAREIFKGVKVIKNSISFYFDETQNLLAILAQKKVIKSSQVQIENNLQALGLNFQNLLDDKAIVDFPREKLQEAIGEKLQEFSIDDKYSIALLSDEQVDNVVKKDIITKMIWPKIKTQLQNSFSLLCVSNNLLKMDKHFKTIDNFAQVNEISISSVIHLIKQPTQYLKEFKDYEKIQENLPEIINTLNKYSDFGNANAYICSVYVETIEAILSKYLKQEDAENILSEKFIFINDEDLSINTLKERLNIKAEKIKPRNSNNL